MIFALFSLIVNIGLVANILWVKSVILGFISLFLYLAFNGYLAGKIAGRWIPFPCSWTKWLTGVFLVFSLVSFSLGVVIVFYQYNLVILSTVVLAVSAGLFLACRRNLGVIFSVKQFVNSLKRRFLANTNVLNYQSNRTPVYIALVLLFIVGFLTLVASNAADKFITAPWQALPAQFAWVIFFLSVIIIGLIFFRPSKYLLIPIILFSLLQHFYLPAVYRLPYGLDDWRHIGMMETIRQEGNIKPFGLAETFVSPKLSYSSFWGSALFLRESLNIDFVPLTVWWQPLFFSFFLPLLLYLVGRGIKTVVISKSPSYQRDSSTSHSTLLRVGRNDKWFPLLVAFLPALFYPLQLYGAISLPVASSFLFFIFFLLTVLTWVNRPSRQLKLLIVFEFCLLFFGYVIYWLIAALITGFLIIHRLTANYQKSVKQKLIRLGYLLASVWLIPIVSLWASPNARFDILTTGMDYFSDFWSHNLQYLLGFKMIGSPRPQAGNLIWHDMHQIFVNLPPFNWQYFDTALLVILIVLILIGLKQLLMSDTPTNKLSIIKSLIVYLFFVSIGSIFLDRYYFGGVHLLTERLDLIVDLILLLVLLFGIEYVISNFKFLISKQIPNSNIQNSKRFGKQNLFQILIILFFAFTITSTFISGPVYGRAVRGHYEAASWLNQDMILNSRQNYCVLSEQFALAALDAVSGGRVANGNFPMQYGYLEESGKLFVNLFSHPNLYWLAKADALAKSPGCYLLIDSRFLADWNTQQLRWLLGREVYRVDGVYVWRYDGGERF